MRKGARQLLFALALLIGVLWAVNNYVIDIQALTERFTNEVHWSLVYLTLFVSEIVVGILPADLFIIWSQSQPMPWLSIAAIQKSTVGFMSTTLRCSIHFVDLEVS